MKQRRFQNRVVESVFTLPVSAVFAALMWWFQSGFSTSNLLGLLFCALTAYVILETNNANALIRVRTRFVSCLWIVGAACTTFLHGAVAPLFVAFCLSVSYSQICRTYQRHDAAVQAFHANLFLSIGSLAFPPMLLLSFCYGVYFSVYMRCMNLRLIMASLIALLLPYWFWMGWCVWQENFGLLLAHLSSIAEFRFPSPEHYGALPIPVLSAWSLVNLLSIVGTVHYLRNRYDDKIKVRMLLYIYVCQTVFFQVAILLQPQFIMFLLPMLMISSSPLVAHYFALTGSRISNLFFFVSLLLFAALAVVNLWNPL